MMTKRMRSLFVFAAQRLFSGSYPILPLQDYFSDLADDEAGDVGFGISIPDHLIDPIDLRVFINQGASPSVFDSRIQ